jgi:hypothetical protein
MFDLPHNVHLHVDLLIEDAILHKSSLFELLGRIWNPIILLCNLIDNRKGALADGSDLVVLRPPFPFFHISAKRRRGEIWGASVRSGENVRLCMVSNSIG